MVLVLTLAGFLVASPTAAQAFTVEVRSFPLIGPPSAPLAEGEGTLVSVETIDEYGRLRSWGRLPAEKAVTAEPGAGTATSPSAGPGAGPAGAAMGPAGAAIGAGAATGTLAPGAGGTVPKKAGPYDGLSFFDLSYDSRGRLVGLAERKGSAASVAGQRRSYDPEGRLVTVERYEKAMTVLRLEIAYEGSGLRAKAIVRDAKGALIEAASLSFSGGGLAGLTLDIVTTSAEGTDSGAVSLAWDAAGRLVRWEERGAPVPAAGAGGAASPMAGTSPSASATNAAQDGTAVAKGSPPAAVPAATSGVEGGSGSEPSLLDLLFPVWPTEAPAFEIFARTAISGPKAEYAAFRASGFGSLPFGRPESGRVEFLWDSAGRLLGAERMDGAGLVDASLACRYDGRGLLVEEELLAPSKVDPVRAESSRPSGAATPATIAPANSTVPANSTAPAASGAGVPAGSGAPAAQAPGSPASPPATPEMLRIVHVYSVDAGKGWKVRSSFTRVAPPVPGDFSPLEYRERKTVTGKGP
jgi:hypothetical protein